MENNHLLEVFMKKLKIGLILVIVAIMPLAFNSIAQITPKISRNQGIVRDLLKLEIKNNKAFNQDAEAINYVLDEASISDAIGPDCFKYTPLLLNAINSNELLASYYNIQGNFGYSFVKIENSKPVLITYNFYESYNNDGDFSGLIPSVTIRNYDSQQNMESVAATDYIVHNYCEPLNAILNQNQNLPIPQLLGILKQRFSK